MKTRFNEVRLRTSNPEQMLGRYLAENVCRKWVEDFIDEDNGEVVSLDRMEVVEDRGTEITQDVLQRLRFFAEAGELKEVLVSNQLRPGYRGNHSGAVPYTVTFVPEGGGSVKLLVRAISLPMAIQVAEDYAEYIINGGFSIKSAKREDNFYIIEKSLQAMNKEEGKKAEEERAAVYYKIDAIVSAQDESGASVIDNAHHTFITLSPDADVARQIITRELAKQLKKEHGQATVSITLSEAKIFNASDIVPAHFTKEYIDQTKVSDYVMDGQRVSNSTI